MNVIFEPRYMPFEVLLWAGSSQLRRVKSLLSLTNFDIAITARICVEWTGGNGEEEGEEVDGGGGRLVERSARQKILASPMSANLIVANDAT